MKSQANKLLLKKQTIIELNPKQLKTVVGGSTSLNHDQFDVPTSQNTVSTRLCAPEDFTTP